MKITLSKFCASLLLCATVCSCTNKVKYEDIYDPIKDVGQFQLPSLTKTPKYCWFLTVENENPSQSLKEYILAASMSGLTARAIQNDKTDVAIWIRNHGDNLAAYKAELMSLQERGCQFLGDISPFELMTQKMPLVNGKDVNINHLFDGYILMDMDNNPQSGSVAVTASHVYNGVIVDKVFKDKFDKAGFKMLYDASNKKVPDAWNEFKDKCATDGMVVMPNNTYELRDVAIQNSWFFMNFYPEPHSNDKGEYWNLYQEVCSTLDNHTMVYGWEEGPHDERAINAVVSENALSTAINDWFYNYCLTNSDYRNRQNSVLADVINPKDINYNKDKRFVSYYMSDGDNNQWMMGGFIEDWYDVPYSSANKVAFGINTTAMPQMAPAAYEYILNHQPKGSTIVEVQGGGVMYSDTYGNKRNRSEALKERARMTAAHMRQHRIKVLGLMAKEYVGSEQAKEAYQTYINENDQLIGLVALQYTPYAGGRGDIYWFKNTVCMHIPVITVKYSLWNEPQNREREGTPKYIDACLDKDENNPKYNLVCIHAWSKFSDQGTDCDELAETRKGDVMGSNIATLLTNHLDDSYEVVSLEELIWQLRMDVYPEETQNFLDSLQ